MARGNTLFESKPLKAIVAGLVLLPAPGLIAFTTLLLAEIGCIHLALGGSLTSIVRGFLLLLIIPNFILMIIGSYAYAGSLGIAMGPGGQTPDEHNKEVMGRFNKFALFVNVINMMLIVGIYVLSVASNKIGVSGITIQQVIVVIVASCIIIGGVTHILGLKPDLFKTVGFSLGIGGIAVVILSLLLPQDIGNVVDQVKSLQTEGIADKMMKDGEALQIIVWLSLVLMLCGSIFMLLKTKSITWILGLLTSIFFLMKGHTVIKKFTDLSNDPNGLMTTAIIVIIAITLLIYAFNGSKK